MLKKYLVFTTFLLISVGCNGGPETGNHESGTPRLVILISIDQMRADYLDRFAPFFGPDGFNRFFSQGTVLTSARYRHAATVTCAGHAALATGASGNINGIVTNDWYDSDNHKSIYCAKDEDAPLIGHNGEGRSPKNLMVPTIGDILKIDSPESKVFAVAGKDRSAIMLAGHRANGAYWVRDSVLTTSTYYMEELPDWVDEFNALRLPQSAHGRVWDRVLAESEYLATQGPDDVWNEEDRFGVGRTFPHRIDGGSPELDRNFYEAYRRSPFEDEVILQFAEQLLVNERLGEDEFPDFLGIGFSSTDRIGHPFGPDSHEIMDNVIRTDRILSALFSILDKRVGLDHVVVVLSADHGVQDFPELAMAADSTIHAGRVPYSQILSEANAALTSQYGAPDSTSNGWVERMIYPHIYLDRRVLSQKNIDLADAASLVANHLRTLPFIDEAIAFPNTDGPANPEFYSWYASRSGDVLVRFSEHYFGDSNEFGTTHGTPWMADSHVPMLWYGLGVKTAVSADPVQVVDLAPTLLRLMHVEAPSSMEGMAIPAVFE